jgi:glutaconate CoA-transferase subunit A
MVNPGRSGSGKVMRMADAIRAFVHDGDCVALEGFTHLIPFAAGHEIIRQRRRDLTLCRLTPDLIYDQLIAAGCVRKLVFSWAGNPGVGSLHAFRRAVEKQVPRPLEIEEYSHFGMIMRLVAGASRLSFMPLRTYRGSQIPDANPHIRTITCPYSGEDYFVVPALNPDVAIIHAQRADADGNTQVWGLMGVQKEVSFAARRVIVVVEEIVDTGVIRADPNRTLIPGFIVSAVVHEPFGAHPSYVHGYYDRDNAFYDEWEGISRDERRLEAYLDEMVYGTSGRAEYARKLRPERVEQLRASAAEARR